MDRPASRPQRSKEFHSGMGRDGIFAKSRDPGIFRDGISLIFLSRDFLGIFRDFLGLASLLQLVINLENFSQLLWFLYTQAAQQTFLSSSQSSPTIIIITIIVIIIITILVIILIVVIVNLVTKISQT